MKVKRITIDKFKLNVLFGFLNSIISALQVFWLIPYIKDYMGDTAYGYISVVNGLVNVLLVISTAVASMGTRFILVSLEEGKLEESKKYFNSELVAMIIAGIIIALIGLIITFNISLVMNVMPRFYKDVQILFLLTIFSFIIQLLSSPFSASFFYTNSIYITYIVYIIDYIGRIVLTVLMFHNGHVVLWSSILSTDIVYTLGLFVYIWYSKKNIPILVVKIKYFSLKHLIQLISSGIWIAISSAGNMMLSSLNTYLSNILCGVFITGVYAAIMQFNVIESTLLGVLVNSLLPKMFKLFSKKNNEGLNTYTVNAMVLVALFLSVVSGGIIVFGNDFMKFWMGGKFVGYEVLIIMTTIYLPISLPSQVLNQSFTVMNKVRIPALATLFFGTLNLILAFLFASIFNMKIYGVALAGLLSQIMRDNIFYPTYYSKITNNFYKGQLLPVLMALLGMCISVVICVCVRVIYNPSTIIKFIIDVILAGSFSLLFVYMLFRLCIKNVSKI